MDTSQDTKPVFFFINKIKIRFKGIKKVYKPF